MIAFAGIRVILTDIEGTTSSLSFVKDVLFPYARVHMAAYVRAHETDLSGILDDVRAFVGQPDLDLEGVISTLLRWSEEDRKATPLKILQGMIWKTGYEAGDFQGHIYEDAVRVLQEWHDRGLLLYVYSSGSVPAQKLLFRHTPYGDLTPLFSGYFDTTTGPKRETESYKSIAAQLKIPAQDILFLSDQTGEIDAALSAGMRTLLVSRDDQAFPLYNMVRNFADIKIQENAA